MESLRTHPSEMMKVMKDLEVWQLNLELAALATLMKSGHRRKKKNISFFQALPKKTLLARWTLQLYMAVILMISYIHDTIKRGETSSWDYAQKLKNHLKHFFTKFQLSTIYRF